MTSPTCGSIRIPIIRTMKSLRPVKRYFASATAARNASAIEAATATRTTIRLFWTMLPEVRPVHRVAEVLERRREREPGRLGAVDVVVRLERGRDHPVDGEDEDDEEREPEQVPGAALEQAPASPARRRAALDGRAAHVVSSMLHHLADVDDAQQRRRSASIRSEIAAPRPKSEWP